MVARGLGGGSLSSCPSLSGVVDGGVELLDQSMKLLGYPLFFKALVTRRFSFTRSTMSEDSAVAWWNSVVTTDFLCARGWWDENCRY